MINMVCAVAVGVVFVAMIVMCIIFHKTVKDVRASCKANDMNYEVLKDNLVMYRLEINDYHKKETENRVNDLEMQNNSFASIMKRLEQIEEKNQKSADVTSCLTAINDTLSALISRSYMDVENGMKAVLGGTEGLAEAFKEDKCGNCCDDCDNEPCKHKEDDIPDGFEGEEPVDQELLDEWHKEEARRKKCISYTWEFEFDPLEQPKLGSDYMVIGKLENSDKILSTTAKYSPHYNAWMTEDGSLFWKAFAWCRLPDPSDVMNDVVGMALKDKT